MYENVLWIQQALHKKNIKETIPLLSWYAYMTYA